MAQCYEYGIGVEEDYYKAFGMYRRAAERGLPAAMRDLSRLYYDGIGVSRNSDKALEWKRRYEQKRDSDKIPDFKSLYTQGCAFRDNYAQNPNSRVSQGNVVTVETARQEQSAKVESVVTSMPKPATESLSLAKSTDSKSDIDVDIPAADVVNEHVFAFIFANENYQDVANVAHAINDGEAMAAYCKMTFGIPESNVRFVKDATLNNMRREIKLMSQIANAYKGDASFIIYYAGHGVPDEDTRKAYLLPVDGFAGDYSTCYSLNDFYNAIGQMPVRRNIVFIDACFSGATRTDEMLFAARGVVITPKEDSPTGNTIVISSAKGNETSYSYDEKQHGLFTYYLLKKIKESKGEVPLGALVEYLKDSVLKKSIVVNSKSQTPTVCISSNIDAGWEAWKLK